MKQREHPDIVFVSMESWDEIWRRNQFVCAELARRHPEMRILFVGVQRNLLRLLGGGRLHELLREGTGRAPGNPMISTIRPLRVAPERFEWGVRLNNSVTRCAIRTAMHRLGITHPLLWINPHYGVHLIGQFGECGVIYDVTDDWIQFEHDPRRQDLVRRQDAEMCCRSDATVVCSASLYQTRRTLSRSLHLIPNGVHVEHYHQARVGKTVAHESARKWEEPVFGYVGTIHEERVDLGLIAEVARAIPAGTIVLVGPEHLNPRQREHLEATGRVRFVGAVPYAKVPSYIAAFDVCLTPHLRTPFTESLNPIKLWEYMATGKPIVSTDVAGFRDFPDLVYLANTPSQFLAGMRDALIESPEIPAMRIAVATQNSWSARVDQIECVIEEVVCGRAEQRAKLDQGEVPIHAE